MAARRGLLRNLRPVAGHARDPAQHGLQDGRADAVGRRRADHGRPAGHRSGEPPEFRERFVGVRQRARRLHLRLQRPAPSGRLGDRLLTRSLQVESLPPAFALPRMPVRRQACPSAGIRQPQRRARCAPRHGARSFLPSTPSPCGESRHEQTNVCSRVDPARDGSRHPDRLPDLYAASRQAIGRGNRRLHLARVRRVPAADQDGDRPAGVLDARRRHRAHGRCVVGRARVREGARLVRHRVADLVAAGAADGEPAATRREPRAAAAGHRRVRASRDVQVHAEGFRRPHGAEVDRRGDGEQRDPADRRVLDVLRRRARRTRRARQDPGRRDRPARARDAEDHRLRDEARAARGDGRDGVDRRDQRVVDPAEVRGVHGRLLREPRAAVGHARHGRAAVPRSPRVQAARADQGSVHAVVRDRELGSRVSEDPRRARPVRRAPQDLELRDADGLFVQPRRLDDVLHVRDAVHRAGVRHPPVARHAGHDAADPDADVEGDGRACRARRSS
ncbi:Uncharacterised protein [Clostridium sporogenes]|nr:Uncharacterised protein [Clostridium sporogenes]